MWSRSRPFCLVFSPISARFLFVYISDANFFIDESRLATQGRYLKLNDCEEEEEEGEEWEGEVEEEEKVE